MSVRLGLLGAGRIGKVHGAAIASTPGARLVAVADALPQAAADIAARYGAEVRSIDAILASADVDAVLITTPTDMHADLIERSARAGKAIFCEKPVDLDAGRVRACLGVVKETGATLMVGFNRRFDPNFQAVKAEIDRGAIGTVETVSITSRDPAPPPVAYIGRSGGMFRDMTIHDFDMARWLLGEEPVTVYATASNLVDPAIGAEGDVDTAVVVLTTASGRMAQISNSRRASYGYDQRIEVHGSKGLASAENIRLSTLEVAGADGYRRPPLLDFFMTRYTAAYAAEIAAFLAAIETGAPVSPTGEDGLKALLIADAAVESARSGQAVRLG